MERPTPRSRGRGGDQLDMFAGAPGAPDAPDPEVQPIITDDERALAAQLPPWIRFGTSSWTFPGWAGILYAGKPSAAALVRTGLKAYAAHPLLRTVGIDRSHYGPLSAEELAGYAAQLPPDFKAVSKVWDEITTFVYPRHPRYGARAGQANPSFLDPARMRDEVLAPYAETFADFTGPFLFEIPPMPRDQLPDTDAFACAIDLLLSALPSTFRYAFELRNRELLTRRYLETLRAHGAAHVLNLWTAMPPIREQLALPGVLTAPFAVCRLMLPPYTRYEDLRAELAPFDKIVRPQPEMREDVVALARMCEELGVRELYVLVNNKVEGSSPLTAFELARAIVRRSREVSPRRP